MYSSKCSSLCLVSLLLSAATAFAQAGIGSVVISGNERSVQVANPATPGSIVVTLDGWEQSATSSGPGGGACEIDGTCPGNGGTIYDSGSVAVVVNGYTVTAYYGSNSTAQSLASDVGFQFNWNSSSPVTAVVSGATVTLTARVSGQISNYSITTYSNYDDLDFSYPSFSADMASTTLLGGQDAAQMTVYDSGSVSANIQRLCPDHKLWPER